MQIATFWQRFGAFWLDFLCILPLMPLTIWASEQWRLFNLYYFLPGVLFGLWFHVYLVKRYGGTPGKLLLKLRIVKLDGTPADYREAMLRYCVLFALGTVSSAALLLPILGMTDAEYYSYGWQERALIIVERAPVWYKALNILMNIWIWSEFLTMLTNKNRRAIHDFIAGTVVIRKAPEPEQAT